MRTRRGRRNALTCALIAVLCSSICEAFVEIPYTKDLRVGPDGPWQAVSLGMKYSSDRSNPDYQDVQFYPSVLIETTAALYLPTQQVCSNQSYENCAVGGSIAPLPSNNSAIWYPYLDTETGYEFYLNGTNAPTDLQFPNNNQNFPYNTPILNADTKVLTDGETTYPSGKKLPIEVGYGCLGGTSGRPEQDLPLSLHREGITQSNSYGLHIGSAKLGYTGSLVFGGYNRGRVIGPVIKYPPHSPLSLVDIQIGVEVGESPFEFKSKTDLLDIPPRSGLTGSAPTVLRPEFPYIYLNQETLDNIVRILPVQLDQSLGLYLWDTSNPRYEQIVSSPSYLGFVFPSASGDTINTIIKVPFQLLNLTLEAAASEFDSDRAYLPLVATGEDAFYLAVLGRGFLQAAFMGTNWGSNNSFLAQAPGPGSDGEGLGYAPVDLANSSTTIDVQQGNDLFQKSWADHWTEIQSDNDGNGNGNGNNGSSDEDSSSGLSGGAIGGIVGGVAGGILIIGFIIALVIVRRKRRAREAAAKWSGSDLTKSNQGYGQPPYSHQSHKGHEIDGTAIPGQEIDGTAIHGQEMEAHDAYEGSYGRHEMTGDVHEIGELPGHEPQELPANARTV